MTAIVEQLTATEKAVLVAIATNSGGAPGWCYSFAAIGNLIEAISTNGALPHMPDIAREDIRDACQALKRRGLAEYHRGLWSDDCEPAGAGYCLTELGTRTAETLAVDRVALTHSTRLERHYRAEAICLLSLACRDAKEYADEGATETAAVLHNMAHSLRLMIQCALVDQDTPPPDLTIFEKLYVGALAYLDTRTEEAKS